MAVCYWPGFADIYDYVTGEVDKQECGEVKGDYCAVFVYAVFAVGGWVNLVA